jgi:hypothetical protein
MYPVRYEADYVEPQNRAKAFFRLILVIPWAIVGAVYALVAQVIAVIAWFALVFTARYPQGLYNFQAGFLRFTGRLYGYAYLQTEAWPPFGMDDDRSYPVRVDVDPRLDRYNRWKALFRLILGIPVMFMLYLIPYLTIFGAIIAWFHIVFMGRTSGGIHNVLTVGNTYTLRAIAYFLLVTETLPPVSDQEPAGNVGGSRSPAAPKAIGSSSPPAATAQKPAARKRTAKKPAAKKTAARRAAAKKPAAKRKPSAGRS